MGFLNKIISHFRKQGKETFKKTVKKEKKQKYLFSGNNKGGKSDSSKRRGKGSSKYLGKNRGFISFIQDDLFGGNVFRKHTHTMNIIGAFLMLLSLYIIFFSPYFKISPTGIVIEAETPGVDLGVAYRTLESIYGQNIFMIDKNKISSDIKLALKNIETTEITRLYPNGIKVLLTSLPIKFDTTIAGIPDKKWGISTNGILVPENDLKKTPFQYSLEIVSPTLIGDIFLQYKEVISSKNMKLVNKVFDIFASEWGSLGLANSRYFYNENELHITTDLGTIIMLSLQSESGIDPKTGLTKTLLNQLITFRAYIANNSNKIKDTSIIYIDARIPGKLFVCRNANICKNNLVHIYGDTYK